MDSSAFFVASTIAENNNGLETLVLVVERADLLKALSHVQSVVERRNTLAILSNVKLQAANGELGLTATDMDVAVVEKIAAQVKVAGATTVPAHMLYDIVRKLPDGAQVSLTVDNSGSMRIVCGQCRFSLPCLPIEDFPVMDEGELPHHFALNVEECRMLVDKTRFAISTEETRYYLNGIYLHVVDKEGEKRLRAAATDGHRLARMEVAVPQGAEAIAGVIIPRKTVTELRKLIEGGEGDVQVALSGTKVRFAYNNMVLLSKLIDGNFPDYEKVVPTANDHIMEVDAHAFGKAVDRVSIIASEKSRAVTFSLGEGILTLHATGEGSGSAREEIAVNYEGVPLKIGFNFRYLLDVMAVLDGEVARFLFADGAAPAIIHDIGNPGALYVVMPMRV